MSFSARKMNFFDKNSNIYPSSPFFTFDVKELFFPMVIFSLNPEGLFGARWRTWWNPPPNIFNLAKNRPFLEELKKKFSNVTRTIYIKCMLPKYIMIHCFLTTFLLKTSNFSWKHSIFICQNSTFFAVFWGSGSKIKIPRQVLWYIWPQ